MLRSLYPEVEVTRSLSNRTILKSWYLQPHAEEKRIIDSSNERIEQKVIQHEEEKRRSDAEKKRVISQYRELSEEEKKELSTEQTFIPGLTVKNIDTYTDEDGNEVYTENTGRIMNLSTENENAATENLNKRTPVTETKMQIEKDALEREKEALKQRKQEVEQLCQMNEELLKKLDEKESTLHIKEEEMNEIIEETTKKALEEAEEIRTKAREEGYQAGLEEGKKEAKEELKQELEKLAEKEQEQEKEYEKRIHDFEPDFIETMTDIYRYIFQVDFSKYQGVIVYLINATLRKLEISKSYIVHVSNADYEYTSLQKKQLASCVPETADLEVVEDLTLKNNECFIETESGVFDCGLGVQLDELEKQLKILSYRKK